MGTEKNNGFGYMTLEQIQYLLDRMVREEQRLLDHCISAHNDEMPEVFVRKERIKKIQAVRNKYNHWR